MFGHKDKRFKFKMLLNIDTKLLGGISGDYLFIFDESK